MLPLPNLDDRWFEQMVEDARKAIPRLMPAWTDENVHDPGITLIELFSWLSEMQQYYLNRITEESERKFLKLLGIRPYAAQRARAEVSFLNVPRELVLPSGTKLKANEQSFETVGPLLVVPTKLERVLVRSGNTVNDYTASNGHNGVSYFAFGTEAKQDSRLYIGFDDTLPPNKPLTLSVKLYDRYPVAPGHGAVPDDPKLLSAKVSWKYFGLSEADPLGAPSWLPVEVLHDQTRHLTDSGTILLQLKTDMRPLMMHPSNDRGRFWLSCTLEEEGYEIPPKVEHISLNTAEVIQQDTLASYRVFNGTGERETVYSTQEYLPYYGRLFVQVKEEDGVWHDWAVLGEDEDPGDGRVCRITRSEGLHLTSLRFEDLTPSEGIGNIRVGAATHTFFQERWIGQTNGLPHQSCKLPVSGIVEEDLVLQIGSKDSQGVTIWEDWTLVDDFDHSKAYDRHFVYIPEEASIRFGNNEHGMVPWPSDVVNIRVLSCTVGGGARGNVKHGLIRELGGNATHEYDGIAVTNYDYASGGGEREGLEQAKNRVRKEWLTPHRAVTAEDYERIVKQTPGLRVARATAIPGFVKGMRDYPAQLADGQVTVVVVPYSPAKKPMPSKGFLERVSRHMEEHRLIGTELHVIPPAYCGISVQASIAIDPHAGVNAARIREVLDAMFRPIDTEDGLGGWDFGRKVYKGDVYGAISRIPGVSFIQDLWIDAVGEGVRKEVNGDITIPPYGLVYSGEHVIEIVKQDRR